MLGAVPGEHSPIMNDVKSFDTTGDDYVKTVKSFHAFLPPPFARIRLQYVGERMACPGLNIVCCELGNLNHPQIEIATDVCISYSIAWDQRIRTSALRVMSDKFVKFLDSYTIAHNVGQEHGFMRPCNEDITWFLTWVRWCIGLFNDIRLHYMFITLEKLIDQINDKDLFSGVIEII